MEYLPRPSSITAPLDEEVPYVAVDLGDGEDFATFPQRHGFELGSLAQESPDRVASLAQSWLYFGTIDMFFKTFNRPAVESWQFQDNNSDKPVLKSSYLLVLLQDWFESTINPAHGSGTLTERSGDRRPLDLAKLYELKKTCNGALETSMTAVSRLENLPQAAQEPVPVVLMSIKILIISLAGLLESSIVDADMMWTFEKSFQLTDIPGTNPLLDTLPLAQMQDPLSPSASIIYARLCARGWCEYRARHICSRHNYAVAYYLGNFPANPPNETHAKCSAKACVANNVDMSSYQTRHVTEGCTCSMYAVPSDELRSIVRSGGVPIISVEELPDGELKVHVKSTETTPYIAFSHVWSDGLGNPHANALPRCQLQRLSQSVRNITLPVFQWSGNFIFCGPIKWDVPRLSTRCHSEWFWLDTLCIPVGNEPEVTSLKMKAINQMAAIYANARQVLVLDSGLERISMQHALDDLCEFFARINLMAWMTRCWTFQEAALSADCQIQLADRSLDPLRLCLEKEPRFMQRLFLSKSKTEFAHNFLRMMYTFLVTGIALLRRDWSSKDSASSEPNAYLYPSLAGRLITRPVTLEEAIQVMFARTLKDGLRDEFQIRRKTAYDSIQADHEAVYLDFLRCWNVLSQRGTTKPDDVHIIIANLLDFNAFIILNMKEPQDRMAAMLWSLPAIPLSMMLDPVSRRFQADRLHRNRWLPLYPETPCESTIGLLHEDGHLVLDSTKVYPSFDDADKNASKSEKTAEKIKGSNDDLTKKAAPKAPGLLSLPLVSKADRVVVSNSTDQRLYEVIFHRLNDDEADFGKDHYTGSIVVFNYGVDNDVPLEELQAQTGPWQAACLHTIPPEQDATNSNPTEEDSQSEVKQQQQYTAVFDCPATVRIIEQSETTETHLVGDLVTDPYILKVMTDPPPLAKMLSRRPPPPRMALIMGLVLTLPFCVVLVLDLCAAILVIITSVRDFRNFPVASQIGAVGIFVFDVASVTSRMIPFNPILYYRALVFLVLRIAVGFLYLAPLCTSAYGGAQLPLAVAAATLTAVSGVFAGLMFTLWKYHLASRIIDAWRDTYDPAWLPETGGGLYYKMGRLEEFILPPPKRE